MQDMFKIKQKAFVSQKSPMSSYIKAQFCLSAKTQYDLKISCLLTGKL